MDISNQHYVSFFLGGMVFEYDPEKDKANIKKHGISLRNAAHVFFDYDRIELYDEENSSLEDRYDTIGNLRAVHAKASQDEKNPIDNIIKDDIIFVVYTERIRKKRNKKIMDVTRLISARYATSFERRMYYDKY